MKVDGHFIAGLVTGEGYFSIILSKNHSCKYGVQVNHCFGIKLGSYDKDLLEEIHSFFGCGYIYNELSKGKEAKYKATMYKVYKFEDLIEKIIPFFETFLLKGVKRKDFNLWKDSLFMRKDKEHLTQEGIIEIAKIRDQMSPVSRHHMRHVEDIRNIIKYRSD